MFENFEFRNTFENDDEKLTFAIIPDFRHKLFGTFRKMFFPSKIFFLSLCALFPLMIIIREENSLEIHVNYRSLIRTYVRLNMEK